METQGKVERERNELLEHIDRLEQEASYKDHIIKSLLRVSNSHVTHLNQHNYNSTGASPVLIPPDLISNWVAIERLLGLMEQRN